MTDWIKHHVEAVICFSLFGLLILTSLYFLSTEEQRVGIGELEEIRVDESKRDEVIEQAMLQIRHQRRGLMTAFMDKPLLHYDLLLRRNPFQPLGVVYVPPPPPPPPNGNDVNGPPEPPKPPEPPRPELVVRGIVRFGDDFIANIENRITGEAYFRRVGEEVEGHLVEDISRDKVVLSVDDEIIELRYR